MRYVAPTLSHHNVGGCFRKTPSSCRRDCNQISLAAVLAIERYSTLVDERETIGCLRELHEIKLEPRKTRSPPVERRSSGHPAQSELINPKMQFVGDNVIGV